MVDPAIFEHLQTKIDEDSKVREELRNKLQDLEKQGSFLERIRTVQLVSPAIHNMLVGRSTQSILSRAHSIKAAQCKL